MKIRNGFVSNSSSSSFVIKLKDITAEQLSKIINHSTVGNEMNLDYARSDAWFIHVNSDTVDGSTSMTNFDMNEFFGLIGISDSVVDWDDD